MAEAETHWRRLRKDPVARMLFRPSPLTRVICSLVRGCVLLPAYGNDTLSVRIPSLVHLVIDALADLEEVEARGDSRLAVGVLALLSQHALGESIYPSDRDAEHEILKAPILQLEIYLLHADDIESALEQHILHERYSARGGLGRCPLV